MTNMDRFEVLLTELVKIGKEIDGVDEITYHFSYNGETESVNVLNHTIMRSLQNGGCKHVSSTTKGR